MISIVVGEQQRLAQDGLPVAVRDPRVQIDLRVLDHRDHLLPVGLVYYVASLVLTAGTIRIISDSYLGREPRLQDALALGWSRLWPLTAVGFGKGIVLMLIMVGVGLDRRLPPVGTPGHSYTSSRIGP